MLKSNFKYSLLSILLFSIVCNLYAIPTDTTLNDKIIYKFEIHQEIDPRATRISQKAIAHAEEIGADYLLLDLNTYGGLVDDADKIRTALINTKIPSIAFIRNNAASAGALISIACDSIYMKEGSTIGAAAVVNEAGEIMPEKYQSYMRNKMRATAEATGRNPDIAEGMVDPKMEIKGITTNEEIITFTVKEAIENNYCIAKAESIDDVIKLANLEGFEIITYKISSVEAIISFFVNPAISGVLLLIIMGGIYFELQSPGIGFPITAAIIAAILYFMPHYLEGLAANWEIVLFFIGVLLLAVEAFVIPGFGIPGVSGILAIMTSLVLSLVRNIDGFDFSFVPQHEMGVAFLTVSIVLIVGVLSFFFGGEKLMSFAFSHSRIGNTTSLKNEDNFTLSGINGLKTFIGKEALVISDLRPSGKIAIDNERYDAISDGEYIGKGSLVKIINVNEARLLVIAI